MRLTRIPEAGPCSGYAHSPPQNRVARVTRRCAKPSRSSARPSRPHGDESSPSGGRGFHRAGIGRDRLDSSTGTSPEDHGQQTVDARLDDGGHAVKQTIHKALISLVASTVAALAPAQAACAEG